LATYLTSFLRWSDGGMGKPKYNKFWNYFIINLNVSSKSRHKYVSQRRDQ
jgi:hypothetical protein